VAVLAFAAIGTSSHTTGEFLRSLFQVMAISLGLSWVLAITLTPMFSVQFLPKPKKGGAIDPYQGRFFQLYRRFLDICLGHRLIALLLLLALLVLALLGFSRVEQNLFPNDNRNQFLLNYWRPEGTHIHRVSKDLRWIEQYLLQRENVTSLATFIGQGGLRFVLTYDPEMPNSSYGQILVTVKDFEAIDGLIDFLRVDLPERFPEAWIEMEKFRRGPGGGARIEARFSGPDIGVLHRLATQAEAIMAADPIATEIRNDWRQSVPVLRPLVAEANARRLAITRSEIADALALNFSGMTVGVYRDRDDLLPVILRVRDDERETAGRIGEVVVFSSATGEAVLLEQIVSDTKTDWETPIVRRYNRRRTVTVGCNQLRGNASALLKRLQPQIEVLSLPTGYALEWGGDHEMSIEANQGLFQMVPVFFLAMLFTVVLLFNAVRQTVIIFLCLPLVSIGVTAGLLLTGRPFGFMCILGYLGLSGMIIKNAVVLIDQIDLEIGLGKTPYTAILDSAVSRLRPVTMASLTTVLGMLPLLQDIFFVGMSITIIGGLTFGTLLTLIVVPILYAVFFRIDDPSNTRPTAVEKGVIL
jgi:multidrug efflux pump subunit AcrB